MRTFLYIIICLFLQTLTAQSKFGKEDLQKVPEAPDYNQLGYWIAHPEKTDAADLVPGNGEISDRQEQASVDVFFVYPTIYSKKQEVNNPWNADVNDKKLNKEIATSTIKNQATVFNGSAKVYAPLYRQAHINVFKTSDLILKQSALDIAYEDVKSAFEYFLNNLNSDRPIIIASHSQGTLHAARLLKDYFDGKELSNRLVVAYLVGMPLATNLYEEIPPCENEQQTGCWVCWNTYARDWYPESFRTRYQNALNTNPLNWKLDGTYAPASKNLGGVLRNYSKIKPEVNDAQNHRGVLWISKPKFFGNFLMNWKRYHVADYNLFYMNIRENVALRVSQYLQE